MIKRNTSRILSLLLTAFMLLGIFPAALPVLAEEKPLGGITVIKASGSTESSEGPQKLFDNNRSGSKWCVNANTGWVVFSTSQPVKLGEMTAYHAGQSNNTWDRGYAGNTKAYALQIFNGEGEPVENDYADESKWTTVGGETNNTDPVKTTTLNMTAAAQYFRLNVTDSGDPNPTKAIRFYELELFTQKKPITISFNAGEGGSGTMKDVSWQSGVEYLLPECGITAPAGKKFAGWTVNGETKQPNETVMFTEDTEITAQWRIVKNITITFNAGNGGSGTMDSVTWDTFKEYTLPECGFTPAEGQKFIGWLVTDQAKQPGEKIALTEDTEITALWRIAKNITITFDAGEGGTGNMPPVHWDSDEKYTIPECGFTAPAGSKFVGWLVNGEHKQPGDKMTLTADATVRAFWRIINNIMVTFNPGDGGTGTMAPVPWDSDVKYTLPECGFTPLANKKFIGWLVNNQTKQPGDTLYLYDATTPVTALWRTITYITITFNAGTGGSGTMDSVKWDTEETYTLPECGFTAPENQKFVGWSVNNEIKQPYARMTLTENTTITAQWKDIQDITVTFDVGEGAAGEMPSVPWDSSELYTLPECTFAVPTGKMFFGWKVGSDEVIKLPGNPVSLKENTVLTAVWLDTEGTAVTQDTVSMTGGLYTVDGDVTVTERIQVTGVVTLDLRSGKLTASKGIRVPEGAVLNIISSTGNGSLLADGANASNNFAGIGADTTETGVGTSNGDNAGTINIYGGNIEATGGYQAAAIGGGYAKTGGNISILGGTVNAVGGDEGCGIGSGNRATGGNVTISGGTVTVTAGGSNREGTGIGSGYFGDINNIIINGGNITVTGYSLPGIGCGNKADCISIGGNCTVIAKSLSSDGYNKSPAIGCGYQCSCEKIEITGGDITASTGAYGYSAIGTGTNATLKELNISGGIIHAAGGENGFGIGMHLENPFLSPYTDCSITITGGIITASGGKGGIIESFVYNDDYNDEIKCTVTKAEGLISENGGRKYTVYGDYTLPADFNLEAESILDVPENTTLNIPEGITLQNDGYIYNDGMILLNGTLTNNDKLFVKLTLNTNGGEITAASLLTAHGIYKEHLNNLGVTRTGYNFLGWFDAETDGNQIENCPLNPVTLYAHWEALTYSILFTVNGEPYREITYKYGAPVTAPEYTVPEGHTFSGWDVPETMPAEDLVLDATLTPNTHTVTLYLNDGSDEVFDTKQVEHGGTVSLASSPERTGYKFTGWYRDEGMTEVWDIDADTVISDMSLYAGWEEKLAYNSSYNMKLGEDISLGFIFHVDESLQDLPDLRLVCNIQSAVPREVELQFSDAESFLMGDGNYYYRFYCPLAAKEMSDIITAKLVSGSGSDTLVYEDGISFSVKDYAAKILSGSTQESQRAVPVVKAMLNYGAAAQTYFDYRMDKLANSILDDGDKIVPHHEFTESTQETTGSLPEGLVHEGCTLMFVNKIKIRFYFSGNIEGVTFSFGHGPVEPQAKDGMHYVESYPISVTALAEPVTLTVTADDGTTWSKTYSVWDYAHNMQPKRSGLIYNVMNAMYDYYNEVHKYGEIHP